MSLSNLCTITFPSTSLHSVTYLALRDASGECGTRVLRALSVRARSFQSGQRWDQSHSTMCWVHELDSEDGAAASFVALAQQAVGSGLM